MNCKISGLLIILLIQVPGLQSCKKTPGILPEILFSSEPVLVGEDVPGGTADLGVYLSSASEEEITVEYSTADSTASAGSDYAAASSGILTFKPGQTSKSITVNIIPNSSVKEDTYFKVVFGNPVNGRLPESKMVVKIFNTDYSKLVWSDEFNEALLSATNWNYELGAGGWGNNELQTYTNSSNNVHLDTGYLHITALNPSSGYYTSGRLTTRGKREFRWFRAEIRARLPAGKGLWPALWMLGANFSNVGWPSCGEIDIMEYLGHSPNVSYGALHWNSNGHTYRSASHTLPAGNFNTEFHTFSLIWTPDYLRWYVDNQQFFFINRSEVAGFPFSLPQFFIFNVAVGGNWPGNPDGTTTFPQNMIVDYVRVYQ